MSLFVCTFAYAWDSIARTRTQIHMCMYVYTSILRYIDTYIHAHTNIYMTLPMFDRNFGARSVYVLCLLEVTRDCVWVWLCCCSVQEHVSESDCVVAACRSTCLSLIVLLRRAGTFVTYEASACWVRATTWRSQRKGFTIKRVRVTCILLTYHMLCICYMHSH